MLDTHDTHNTRDHNDAHDRTAELVSRARGGDLQAFNALVLLHQDQAYSLALRFLGARAPAEDATQEAFLRAWKAIGSFRGDRFRSWLLSIVANACRDELRRRKRRPQQSLDAPRDDEEGSRPLEAPDPGAGPEASALNADLRAALERALLELPEDWRLVVVLSDVHGLAYDEIAEVTGLALGTVKSRLSRARARLRDILVAAGELPRASERLTQ